MESRESVGAVVGKILRSIDDGECGEAARELVDLFLEVGVQQSEELESAVIALLDAEIPRVHRCVCLALEHALDCGVQLSHKVHEKVKIKISRAKGLPQDEDKTAAFGWLLQLAMRLRVLSCETMARFEDSLVKNESSFLLVDAYIRWNLRLRTAEGSEAALVASERLGKRIAAIKDGGSEFELPEDVAFRQFELDLFLIACKERLNRQCSFDELLYAVLRSRFASATSLLDLAQLLGNDAVVETTIQNRAFLFHLVFASLDAQIDAEEAFDEEMLHFIVRNSVHIFIRLMRNYGLPASGLSYVCKFLQKICERLLDLESSVGVTEMLEMSRSSIHVLLFEFDFEVPEAVKGILEFSLWTDIKAKGVLFQAIYRALDVLEAQIKPRSFLLGNSHRIPRIYGKKSALQAGVQTALECIESALVSGLLQPDKDSKCFLEVLRQIKLFWDVVDKAELYRATKQRLESCSRQLLKQALKVRKCLFRFPLSMKGRSILNAEFETEEINPCTTSCKMEFADAELLGNILSCAARLASKIRKDVPEKALIHSAAENFCKEMRKILHNWKDMWPNGNSDSMAFSFITLKEIISAVCFKNRKSRKREGDKSSKNSTSFKRRRKSSNPYIDEGLDELHAAGESDGYEDLETFIVCPGDPDYFT